MRILNLIFHNFVLISEFKYNLLIMQLRLHPRNSRNVVGKSFVIKTILSILIFILAIFLLDKIEITPPNEAIKQEISNDKLITVK